MVLNIIHQLQMKQNIIRTRTISFAIEIISFSKLLVEKKQFDIARQILKSGTSIGANVAEAQGAISKNDFSNKMCIAYKESLETEFWLTIIRQANIVDSELCHEIQEKVIVISKVLFSILKTMGRVTRIPKEEIN